MMRQSNKRRLLFVAWFVMIAAWFVFMVFALRTVEAHDAPTGWTYPSECCSNKDCRPVSAESCDEVAGGRVFEGKFIPHERIRPSPDGDCHVCKKGNAIIHSETPDTPTCAWAPMGGF